MMEIKRADLQVIEGYPKSDARNRLIYLFRQRDAKGNIIAYVVSVPDKMLVRSYKTRKDAEAFIEKSLIIDSHPFNGDKNMDIKETASIFGGHISEIEVQQQQQTVKQETTQTTQTA